MGNCLSVGNTVITWGTAMVVEIKKVDAQGRISLPARWRGRKLKGVGEVVVIERDDALVIKAKVEPDLTKHFDAVPVDVDPRLLDDYAKLKQSILGRRSA